MRPWSASPEQPYSTLIQHSDHRRLALHCDYCIIAITASGFALGVSNRSRISLAHLCVGAVMLGGGISAMHYVGMAAIQITPTITYELGLIVTSVVIATCFGTGTDQRRLALIIAIPAVAVLSITTVLLVYDSHLESHTRKHNQQLEQANAQLEHAATHDSLTGLPNRLLLADRLAQVTAQSERYSRDVG